MPLVPQSQADRIKKKEERNTYANYVIDQQAVREKLIQRANIIGGSDAHLEESAYIPIARGPTHFTQDEITNILFENSIQSVPTGLYIDKILPGNGFASITFRLEFNGASYIKDYLYSLDGITYISVGYLVNPIIINGLENGVTYSITIKAVNSIGISDPSNTAYVTPATVPSAPIISAVPGNGLAIITYDSNFFNGGAPVIDYRYSLNAGVYSSFVSVTNPLIISSLINGSNYIITIKAVNYVGASEPSNSVSVIPAMVPYPPTITSIAYGDTIVYLYFTPGFDGYNAVIDYEYSIDTGITYTSFGSTSNPLFISGLMNGITYQICIRARNFIGYSQASSIVSVIPRTIPSPPTITKVEIGNSQAIVFFTISFTGGSPIIDYEYSLGSGYISAGLNSPFIINGLSNGTTYELTMRLVNDIGNSSPSQSVSFIPGNVPSQPLIHVSLSNMSAILFFTIDSDSGYPITSYYYSIDSGNTYSIFSNYPYIGTLSNSYIITGLTNGTMYQITMFCSNSIGSSPTSFPYNVTPGTLPTISINSLALSNMAAVLGFTVTDTGGYAVSSYYYSLDGTIYTPFAPTGNFYTISNLTNGSNYSVTIEASNAIGMSLPSSASNVTPGTVPSQALTTVELSNMSALLSFTIADNGGYAITSYYYSIDRSNYTSFVPTNGSYQILNLSNGTTYPVTMFSSNALGSSLVSAESNVTPGTFPIISISSLVLSNMAAVLGFTVSDTGGYAVSSYYYSLDGTNYTPFTPTGNFYTISNLTNGSNYSVTIEASNAIGMSLPSSASNVTPGTVPSQALTTVNLSNMSALLSFTIADNGGYAITSYYYSIDRTNYTSFVPTNDSYKILNLSNGTTYPVTMFSSNALGSSLVSTESNVTPGTFPIISISSLVLSNMAAVLGFTVSDTGGYAVSSYYYSLDGTNYTPFTPTGNFYTISNLTNGSNYSVTIEASNAIGMSLPSSASNVTPGAIPDAPSFVSLVPGNYQATITFTPGNSNGYTSEYYYSIGGPYIQCAPISNVFTITNLIHSNYTVIMKASNAIGVSLPSSASNVTPFSAPIISISSLAFSDSAAVLGFVVNDTGGYPVSSYYYSIDSSNYTSFIPDGNFYTITGLTNGLMYSVTIKASNSAGLSLPSSASNVIPGVVPSQPVISLALSNMAAILSFTIANEGTLPITSYYYNLNNGAYINFGSLNNPYTITGLTNGINYSVTMKASNAIGISQSSLPANVIPGAIPDPPSFVSLVPGNYQATITFTPGNSNGYTIQSYYYSIGGPYIDSGLGTVFTISNLIHSNYTVTMKASNAIGLSLPVTSNVTPYSAPIISISSLTLSNSAAILGFIVDTGGYSVLSYYYKLNDGGYIPFTPSGNFYTISNLTNGSNYSVTIQASNLAGLSSPSATSNVIPGTVPSQPIMSNIMVAPLSFTIMSNGGYPIKSYYYNLNGGAYISFSPSGNSYTIPDLSNSVAYQVRIYASNDVGSSPISEYSYYINTVVWNTYTINPFGLSGSINNIAWNGSNLWCAVGKNFNRTVTAAYSSDGSNWISSINNPFSGGVGVGIGWNSRDSYWCAVGYDGSFSLSSATSTDGSNWTSWPGPFPGGQGRKIAWNGSYWCAVGQNSGNSLTAAISLNGSNWTYPTRDPCGGEYGYGLGIGWNSQYSIWCAVGYYARGNNNIVASISSDGLNWTDSQNNPFTGGTGCAVVWNGSNWCISGNGGTSIFSALISTTGLSWIPSSPFSDTKGKGIAWNGSFFFASGTTSCAVSVNGSNWVSFNSPLSNSDFFESLANISWNGTNWYLYGLINGVASIAIGI